MINPNRSYNMHNVTVSNYCNDSQYSRVKDDMRKNIFNAFVAQLVDDYAEVDFPQVYIYLSWLSPSDQKELLKQYFFFEGYIEWWEEIYQDESMIKSVLDEHYKILEQILKESAAEKEINIRASYMDEHDLVARRHSDNGEVYYTRR